MIKLFFAKKMIVLPNWILKRTAVVTCLLILLWASCTTRKVQHLAENSSVTRIEAKQLSDSLHFLMQRIAQTYAQPELNLTLGVVKDGQVLLKQHFGYSNPISKTRFSDQTQAYIASTSKSLTGTFAAILHRKGLINLDFSIADYLPSFKFNDPKLNPAQITMRALLTHTHGIQNNSVGVWTSAIGHKGNEHLLDLYRKYSSALPDHHFNYTNIGPVLYSIIVAEHLGKPWQDLMQEELFKPLDMLSTTSYVSKADRKLVSYIIERFDDGERALFNKVDQTMSAAGGHLSTVDDLLKYLQFFIDKGKNSQALLSEEEIGMAISPLVPQKSRYHAYERYGYGLGWEQSIFNGEHLISRLGGYGGIASHLSFLRDHRIGIFVLGNTVGFESLPHLVANYCYNILLDKANVQEMLNQDLLSLSKNFNVAKVNQQFLDKAIKKTSFKEIEGNYTGGEESGSMKINKNGVAKWGNLKGQIYFFNDTAGMIDFGSMKRSLQFKKENDKLLGLFSNDRYFIKR